MPRLAGGAVGAHGLGVESPLDGLEIGERDPSSLRYAVTSRVPSEKCRVRSERDARLQDARRKRRGGGKVESRKLEVGSWKSKVGSWKLEVESWKLEVGSRKSEVGSRKSEVEGNRAFAEGC